MSYRTPDARKSSVREVRNALLASRRTVLTTHLNADGDGAGCEAALASWLRANGTEAWIVNPTPFPDQFRFLVEEHWIVDASRRTRRGSCDQADLAVVVDTGEVPRIGRVRSLIRELQTVVMDHHQPGDQPIGGISLRDPQACATGELVFDVMLGGRRTVDRDRRCEGMYVAILTDTGSFRFTNSTPGSHRVVGGAGRAGRGSRGDVRPGVRRGPGAEVPAAAPAPWTTLEVDEEAGVAWMDGAPGALSTSWVPHPTTSRVWWTFPAGWREPRSACSSGRRPPGEVKISFRSNGPVDVNELAKRFGGGGHIRASGAMVPGPMARAVRDGRPGDPGRGGPNRSMREPA